MFLNRIEETGRPSMPMIRPLLSFVRTDEADYYRRRALQEQIAAQKATCAAARERHDQLAAMYRFGALMGSDEPVFAAKPIEEKVLEAVG